MFYIFSPTNTCTCILTEEGETSWVLAAPILPHQVLLPTPPPYTHTCTCILTEEGQTSWVLAAPILPHQVLLPPILGRLDVGVTQWTVVLSGFSSCATQTKQQQYHRDVTHVGKCNWILDGIRPNNRGDRSKDGGTYGRRSSPWCVAPARSSLWPQCSADISRSYHGPHTPSAGALSDLRSPPPVNNNHSVRHLPWVSHSVSRCSVKPAISTTCQLQPHYLSTTVCVLKVNFVDNDPSMGERYLCFIFRWRLPRVQSPTWICPRFTFPLNHFTGVVQGRPSCKAAFTLSESEYESDLLPLAKLRGDKVFTSICYSGNRGV